MERQFIRKQERSFFGANRFYLTGQVSLSPLKLQTAVRHRLLGSIIYCAIDLDQRKDEGAYAWLFRLLIGSTTGQIVRLADLLDGVTLRANSISDILNIETQINERLGILNARLIAAANYSGSELITIGDHNEENQGW